MGQRQQIFIKIANPVFNKNARTYDKVEMKKMRKLFGRKKTTVIPLHHQWLYGRSSVAMLWNILNVTDAETLGRMAYKLYLKNGGSYFDVDDATDFMEQELEDNGDELTDEELVRNIARYMLDLGEA